MNRLFVDVKNDSLKVSELNTKEVFDVSFLVPLMEIVKNTEYVLYSDEALELIRDKKNSSNLKKRISDFNEIVDTYGFDWSFVRTRS